MVIAQEIIHRLKRTASKVGNYAKIDLEKAYDKVNWTFILNMLKLFNFLIAIIKLVHTCTTYSNMSLLWNGEKITPFKLTRGIRQGGPLFPFLFVIYLERLSMLIMEGTTKTMAPIPFFQRRPKHSSYFIC